MHSFRFLYALVFSSLCLTTFLSSALAQSYAPVQLNITPLWDSQAAWGDFDNDGDFDLLISGLNADQIGITILYRNDNGTFVDTNEAFEGLYGGSGAWGDFDNDGDIDLLLTGKKSSNEDIALIYENTPSGFRNAEAELTGANHGTWGDYDNDGDLDILLVGSKNLMRFSRIYENENGQFSNIGAEIPGVQKGRGRWGDIDQDGDLDILISGQERTDAFSPVFTMYLNNSGDFTYAPLSLWLEDTISNAAFEDFNSDGDLEFLRAKYNDLSTTEVSSDIFSVADPSLPGPLGVEDTLFTVPNFSLSDGHWGDLDNDGDLDAIIPDEETDTFILFTNDNQEIVKTELEFAATSGNTVTLSDYDNDNDIDILVSGNGQSIIYNNNSTILNTPPSPPNTIEHVITSDRKEVFLNWTRGNDAETARSGLAYALRVGTSPESGDVVSSMSLKDGRRKVVDSNTLIQSLNWKLTNLKPATYFWSVQSLDNSHASSSFSQDQTFSTRFINDSFIASLNQAGNIDWGDYDNDGDLDILVTNDASNSMEETHIYRNDDGLFTDINFHIEGEIIGATWGDYDNDGDLDILSYGFPHSDDNSYSTKIYRNTFNAFSEANVYFPPNYWRSATWGDYDKDGDLDILYTELADLGNTGIYRNDSGVFTDLGLVLPGASSQRSYADWRDFEGDGDLDILLVHCDNENFNRSCIFINEDGLFEEQLSFLVNQSKGEAAWGDYDNDGDLDVFVLDNGLCILMNTAGNLSESTCSTSTSTPTPFIKPVLGDFDSDGDLDFYSATSGIHRNDEGNFLKINAGLQSNIFNAAAWGDYDKDGDLDVITAGLNVQFHRNEGDLTSIETPYNSRPVAPSRLSVEKGPTSAILTWEPGSDFETPAEGLSYNLYIGTTQGGHDILSPMSQEDGMRMIQAPGNAGQGGRWLITDLLPGRTYFWGVQTIDAVFDGSEFQPGPSFILEGLAPPNDIIAISSENGIQITWNEIEDPFLVDNYQIYRQIQTPDITAASFDSTASISPGVQGYQDEEVEPGTSYAYRILAEGVDGSQTNLSEQAVIRKVPFNDAIIPFDTTLPVNFTL